MSEQTGRREFPTLFTQLPGPDRKRVTCPYSYQLSYRNPRAQASGCRMIWEVTGGRMAYQIVLEQKESGSLCLHCSCADAVFRAEAEGRFCKHVRGLLQIGLLGNPSIDQLQPRARLRA